MNKHISLLAKPILTAGLIVLTAALAFSAEKAEEKAAAPEPAYKRADALGSIIDPHNQIDDEGEILWGTCMVCHKNVPDIKAEKSIKDVKLRFEDDMDKVCRQCHTVGNHPGSEGVGAMMSGFVAPNHLVAPRKDIFLNMRLAVKENRLIFPLDPKSGRIICATCHNPHERGLLIGRADAGGDYMIRLRSSGMDICQYCHRK